jgi:hypothetical protein
MIMKRTPETTERFFPEIDWRLAEIEDLGYSPIRVSVFDHYLTEEERVASNITFHHKAKEASKLEEYSVGEGQFLSLYRELASEGAYIERDGSYWLAKADDVAFVRMLAERLREWGREQIYFIGPQIRLYGHDDRTDLLLLRSKDYLPKLEELVRHVGLHTLPFKSR